MSLPKATGADIEFGNSIIGHGANLSGVTSWTACKYLLAEAPGWRDAASRSFSFLPSWGTNYNGHAKRRVYSYGRDGYYGEDTECTSPSYAASIFRDYGRCWFIYCLYGDMGHAEGCLPITLSCYDHVAALHGLYNIVAKMRLRAKDKLPEGQDLFVTINNTDGSVRTSYGAHLNVLVMRRLFDDIFHRKPHYLAFAASALAAATPLFGQGYILCIPGSKPGFVLSQRAHHIGVLVSSSTTTAYRRPLINSRDENHAHKEMARLHLINFDASLQQYTVLFRVWFVQSLFAAMESGYCDSSLMLEDPLLALRQWSGGFSPETGRIEPACPRVNGKTITLYEQLESITEGIDAMYAAGAFTDAIVPEYKRVFLKWVRLLQALREGDMTTCASQLDWALKFLIMEREMIRNGHDLDAPEIRILDQLYGHVDKDVGLTRGLMIRRIEKCLSQQEIAHMETTGPENTRAYTRKAILEKFAGDVVSVDWGEIRIRIPHGSGYHARERRIHLDDPLKFTKAQIEPLIRSASSIGEFCTALDNSLFCQTSTPCGSTACTVPAGPAAISTPFLEGEADSCHSCPISTSPCSIQKNKESKPTKGEGQK